MDNEDFKEGEDGVAADEEGVDPGQDDKQRYPNLDEKTLERIKEVF
mgnify:CR=1 FL=1